MSSPLVRGTRRRGAGSLLLERPDCRGMVESALSRAARVVRVRTHWLGDGIVHVEDGVSPHDACAPASIVEAIELVRSHADWLTTRVRLPFGEPSRVRTTVPGFSDKAVLETRDDGGGR